MLQVYNYLLEGVPTKRRVDYPAHKRSELRRVYKDIVNLSKNTPFYKINLSQENKEYAISVKESAIALKVVLKNMQETDYAGFRDKTVDVSDNRAVSAILLKEDTENLPDEISLKVDHLASVQVNRGKDLLHTSKGLPIGEYRFRAYVGENVYDLAFAQGERLENKELLNKMADFLNRNIPELNASVEKGADKDYSHIVIAAYPTGRFGDLLFTFDNMDDYGTDIVDYFGLNRMDQPATRAEFQLNDIPKHTATNTFTLENTMKITLSDVTEAPVILRIVPDSEKILNAVDTVVKTYNDLIQLAKNRIEKSPDHYRAAKLLNEMQSFRETYRQELEAVGFKLQEDGFLALEDSLAVQATKDGGMESFFLRENGFITRLMDKTESIVINPMEYLEKTIVTYPRNDKEVYRNPYVTSMYSGLFFSSYC